MMRGYYPKYSEDFFDVTKTCAEFIDNLCSVEDKIKYNDKLNIVFVNREYISAIRLYKELTTREMYTTSNSKGGHHGKS